jgi:Raf kinase inhibitor-like YbhB/YbcL family protein
MMGTLGRLLRNVRAGEHRSPLAGAGFAAPHDIRVTSTAFSDGGAMPPTSAGKGIGDNTSPQLRWTGLPPETRQLVLIMDDVDVPLPRPLLHTVAVIEPGVAELGTDALQPGTAGVRFIPGDLRNRGYAGPRPIPGHGPHRYRFQVFALDEPMPDHVTTAKALLKQMAGHVLARGVLTGTYERPHRGAPAAGS